MLNWYKMAQEDVSLSSWIDTMIKVRESCRPERYYYCCLEHFLKENGKLYTSQPFTQEEIDFMKKFLARCKNFKMKECFYNAQQLSNISHRFKYVEGLVYCTIIPIHHAWNTLNGKIIDFTLARAHQIDPVLGVIPEGWKYYGVELETSMIRELWRKHKMSCSLIDNWKDDFPLFKEKFVGTKESTSSSWYKTARKSHIRVLKENKIPLTEKEREICFKEKAVWHHGTNGKETCAIWKAKVKGKIFYVTNTHRAYHDSNTLKGAIKAFHESIKDSA